MQHTVSQGECLAMIAYQYGFAKIETIWERPENSDLRDLRKNPNILFAGDQLFIPEPEPREEDKPTDQLHKFLRKRPTTKLRLRLEKDDHEPRANTRYKLEIGSQTFEGESDGDGLIEETIPADQTGGTLTLWFEESSGEGTSFPIQMGHVDPVDELSGVQSRLNNLGYICPTDGALGDETIEALEAFQADHGLTVTGQADEQTLSKLTELHDGE